MDKLKMESKDILSENIENIANLFPNCLVESEDGKKIDFDLLRQELSKDIVEGPRERYHLDFPGKREAIVEKKKKITKTLRPIKEKSVNFDTTKNIYIEGDNLEALKILQESYLDKIKCIYIDPPYNTGNDFVYNDDFSHSEKEELEKTGRLDENGNVLTSKDINNESNGRYHSDWLKMMYPRLKLARNLLSDDGVIFISIDDREVENLRKLCDEIFGENNFLTEMIWKNKFGSGAMTAGFIGVHEYIIVYSKSDIINITRKLTKDEKEKYNKTRDSKFEKRGGYVTQPLAVTTFGDRPNLRYPINYLGQEIWPEKQWVWEKKRMLQAIANDEVVFNKQKDGSYKLRSKKYLIDENGNERRGKPTTFYSEVYTQNGTDEIRKIFEKSVFDYSKPVELLQYILGLEINNKKCKGDIILDFFSGSATSAHAVMKLNAEDGENRQFIMVQLPEATDEDSEAYKAGFKNICDIGEERIRRAGKKILEENKDAKDLDIGFRVYKIDDSNMKDVYYKPNEILQKDILDMVSNVKEDRSAEDLLTQVILDLGLTLDLPITEKTIKKNKIYYVADNALVACFDNVVSMDILDEMAKVKPLKICMKENSFSKDQDKINFIERLKKLSPDTEVYTI